jgi:hypothetical protein
MSVSRTPQGVTRLCANAGALKSQAANATTLPYFMESRGSQRIISDAEFNHLRMNESVPVAFTRVWYLKYLSAINFRWSAARFAERASRLLPRLNSP